MKKLTDKTTAIKIIEQAGDSFAVLPNPEYVFPQYEVCPLAKPITSPVDSLQALLMDMDGTTTTTEELCIHSLEFMIRKMSGLMLKDEWNGLDHAADYPNIIGNSTTKHVEYLVNKYKPLINNARALSSFVYAAVWTLVLGRDKQRADEVKNNLSRLGMEAILNDQKLAGLIKNGGLTKQNETELNGYFSGIAGGFNPDLTGGNLVRIAIDIYYQRYHQILELIKAGKSAQISEDLFGTPDRHLIEPMPGVEVFLPLVKGLLGSDAPLMLDQLIAAYSKKAGTDFGLFDRELMKSDLLKISRYFTSNPARVAIVTSSILYEADIVVGEVFKLLRERFRSMPLPAPRIELLEQAFSSYQAYYDGFVTASDSSEIRLKPHRDLYSIALHRIGVAKDDFCRCAGFEDSESGTIAIRAAGIGLCVALPFAQTSGHNFDAASCVCPGGLPEVLLNNKLFLNLLNLNA